MTAAGCVLVLVVSGCAGSSIDGNPDAAPDEISTLSDSAVSDGVAFDDVAGDAGADARNRDDANEGTRDAESADAPRRDAAMLDAGPDAGPGCNVPGALLCEDFESGRIDTTRWSLERTNATLAVETGRAAGGRYALHARVEGREGSNGFLHNRDVFPVARNHFFGRAMVYFERHLPDQNFIVVEATGPLGDAGGPARYGLGGVNGSSSPSDTEQLFRLVYHPGDYSNRSTSHPPIDRWACWQWEFDGSADVIRFWLDGRATPEVVATASERPPWVAPTFREIAIGFRVAHADSRAAYDVWIDSVVLATSRVGCPR